MSAQVHLMTPEEWASLSAESRHKINVWQMECEKMQAALRALWTSRPAGLEGFCAYSDAGRVWLAEMRAALGLGEVKE